MNKNIFYYDSYERHKKVGSLLGRNQTVLDVGGQLNALAEFSKNAKITVANLIGSQEDSDVILKGDKLPFVRDRFDAVCSIDVLEHIKKTKRKSFIYELLRVAKKNVILSFPIGTKEHILYEKSMHKWLKNRGIDVFYLEEHIKYGLPQKKELEKYLKGLDYVLVYSGNIKINKHLFKMFLFDPKIKIIRKLTYWSKLGINFLTNPFLYAVLGNKKYSERINRAYLLIKK